MTVLSEARRHYELRQALAARTAGQAAAAWRELDRSNLGASYQVAVAPRLLRVLTSAQLASALMADPYTNRILAAQGLDVDGFEVNPQAFVGFASDGRPLATLLATSVVETQFRLRRGEPFDGALQSGLATLDRIIRTQVQDAGRAADGVAAVGRRSVTGYYRYLSPPSCSRCAVLAGKFFRANTGFQRHPRCDCTHTPGTKDTAQDVQVDPRAYFESLSAEQQQKIFTNAGAEAIRDGADIGQVVNARRGMTAAGTTEGTTRRTGRSQVRLMPEQIYAQTSSRADARNLLVANGYLL